MGCFLHHDITYEGFGITILIIFLSGRYMLCWTDYGQSYWVSVQMQPLLCLDPPLLQHRLHLQIQTKTSLVCSTNMDNVCVGKYSFISNDMVFEENLNKFETAKNA